MSQTEQTKPTEPKLKTGAAANAKFLPVGNFPSASGPNSELSRAEKYEKLAFTFCKLGTAGLICWALTPPIFVLLVAISAVALYARAVTLGLTRSRCFLRKPMLIMGFWAVVIIADIAYLFLR